jgi:hypothetical protein
MYIAVCLAVSDMRYNIIQGLISGYITMLIRKVLADSRLIYQCQDPYFHTLTIGRQRNVFSDTALQFGFGSRTKASS